MITTQEERDYAKECVEQQWGARWCLQNNATISCCNGVWCVRAHGTTTPGCGETLAGAVRAWIAIHRPVEWCQEKENWDADKDVV